MNLSTRGRGVERAVGLDGKMIGAIVVVGLAVAVVGIFAGASGALVTSVVGIVFTQALQRQKDFDAHQRQAQREIEAAQRQQKIAAYQESIDTYFRVFVLPTVKRNIEATYGPVNENGPVLAMLPMLQKLILWGSDEVLRDFFAHLNRALDTEPTTPNEEHDESLRLILVLRRDLGYQNAGVDSHLLYPMLGLKAPEDGSQDSAETPRDGLRLRRRT